VKKIIRIIVSAGLCFCLLFASSETITFDAVAATNDQIGTISEDEALLERLIAYRDSLVKAGISGVELNSADAAIVAQKIAMATKGVKTSATIVSPAVAPVNTVIEDNASKAKDTLNADSAQVLQDVSKTDNTSKLTDTSLTENDAALLLYYATLNTKSLQEKEAAISAQQEAQKQQEEAQKQYVEALAASDQILQKGAKTNPLGVIIIGDSRTNMMHEAVGDTGTTFIAENSKGYDWMISNALPRADKLITAGTKVVFTLGVNDTRNADKYISKINEKAFEWAQKGAIVYYATVNPVWENPYTSPLQVEEFNRKLVAGLKGVNIIDTYTYLKLSGYNMIDGLHFDTPTNAKVYLYILANL